MSNSVAVPISRRSMRLLEVARKIELAFDQVGDEGVALVRLANLAGAVELALLPLSPVDLIPTLTEMVTPSHWEAVGVVLTGYAKRLAEDDGDLRRLRLARSVVLCDRRGTFASVIRLAGEEPILRLEKASQGPSGKIGDALRRSMRLATAPPATSIHHFLAVLWVHRVYSVATANPGLSRYAIDNCRPAPCLSWSDVHQQCAQGQLPELGISTELANWMDTGMFSRWAVTNLPEISELLEDLSHLLSSSTYRYFQAELVAYLQVKR